MLKEQSFGLFIRIVFVIIGKLYNNIINELNYILYYYDFLNLLEAI